MRMEAGITIDAVQRCDAKQNVEKEKKSKSSTCIVLVWRRVNKAFLGKVYKYI